MSPPPFLSIVDPSTKNHFPGVGGTSKSVRTDCRNCWSVYFSPGGGGPEKGNTSSGYSSLPCTLKRFQSKSKHRRRVRTSTLKLDGINWSCRGALTLHSEVRPSSLRMKTRRWGPSPRSPRTPCRGEQCIGLKNKIILYMPDVFNSTAAPLDYTPWINRTGDQLVKSPPPYLFGQLMHFPNVES